MPRTAASAEDCFDCGSALTAEEAQYYLYRCEACERDYSNRLGAWMNGAPDRYLDVLYRNSQPRKVH